MGNTDSKLICRPIFDEICIHANGDIACHCSDPAGLSKFGNVHKDKIADIYNGEGYVKLRQWQMDAKPNSHCPVLGHSCGMRVSRPTIFDKVDQCTVKNLILEPISHCNLKCEDCSVTVFETDPNFRKDRLAKMSLETMYDVVNQLPELERLYFFNYGETFIHPDAIEFLRWVRKNRPEIFIICNTNALMFKDNEVETLIKEHLLNKLVFAIDGTEQKSYEKYRVGGDFEKAFGAMKEAAEACDKYGMRDKIELTWQYILFKWNDSDDELKKALEMSKEIKVPITWVLTHSKSASEKYLESSEEHKRLCGESDLFNSMSCGLRMESLWNDEGVTGNLHMAQFELNTDEITVSKNGRYAVRVNIKNISDEPWEGKNGFRLGVQLRTKTGRIIKELHGVPMPKEICAVGGQGDILFDAIAPSEPGQYQLYFDVVMENVGWFSHRSSYPGGCILNVEEKETPEINLFPILRKAYGIFNSQEGDSEGLNYWNNKLQEGMPIEVFGHYFSESKDEQKIAQLREEAFKFFNLTNNETSPEKTANITLNTSNVSASKGQRIALKVDVSNNSNNGNLKLEVQLRNNDGVILKGLESIAIPNEGSSPEILFDTFTPEEPGQYQLFFEVYDEDCSNFCSEPTVCSVTVQDSTAENQNIVPLIESAYKILGEREPDQEGLEYWKNLLEKGVISVEKFSKLLSEAFSVSGDNEKITKFRNEAFTFFK